MNNNCFSNEDNHLLIKQHIELYGWHVNKIEEDLDHPAFGYSIGLYETYKHPEIIIIGPEVDIIHFMINKIGEAISNGIQFRSGFYYPSLVPDAHLYFTQMDASYYDDYVSHATYYYRSNHFSILQCLYPAPNGSYPGQAEFPQLYNYVQPYLGQLPIVPMGFQNRAAHYTFKLPLPQLG